MSQKSYRIRTNVSEDSVVKVQMTQDIDFLEILSMKISQENIYQLHSSNYGVLVGRVVGNDAFGVENVKVSVFVPLSAEDASRSDITALYPYYTLTDVDRHNVKYNLLFNDTNDECYAKVGTFPTKRLVLDNDTYIEIFEKYWRYTTVTNASGDYMIYGVPVGTQEVHIEVDLSDCGILSQKPIDLMFKGYDGNEFANPMQFKTSTNLDDLAQIIRQDKAVNIYPFWGDSDEGEIAISRCDIQLQYKFEPTCVFMGGVVTDNYSNRINQDCKPTSHSGYNSRLIAPQGTIEMIRKTPDGFVEDYPIQGNNLIDEDGVFCYQIPMNLDYIATDEFGNTVPTDNPKKGIPTRASVRFRFSVTETGDEGVSTHRAKILVPNNPYLKNDKRKDDFVKDYNHLKTYEFGSATQDGDYRDLYWNNVYSVKSYIPRLQQSKKYKTKNYSALRSTNLTEKNNPIPFNNIRIRLPFRYVLLCLISSIVATIIRVINNIVTGLSALTCFMKLFGHCIGIPKKAIKSWANCIEFRMVEEGDGDDTDEKHYYPGCGGQAKKWVKEDHPEYIVNTEYGELMDKVQQNLALDTDVTNFDFYNDWLNGSLYFPLWFWRKTKKKKYLFGLFTKKAVNTYCDCNRKKTMYKGQACAITSGNEINDPHKKFSYKNLAVGLIKEVQNMAGLNIYYYLSTNETKDKNDRPSIRLYATDLILLGSLNASNTDGLPQLFTKLPSTTSNVPEMAYTSEDGVDLESGLDWENKKQAKADSPKYKKGLLYDLSCFKINTLTKSCVNTKRLCELGVTIDSTYAKQVPSANGIVDKIIAMDGMVTHYEINDDETRAMFATLNHNGLTKKAKRSNKIYDTYNLTYMYPYDFDGLMNTSAKKYGNLTDPQDASYMTFRYGYKSFIYEQSTQIPQTNNSFYFYFGLNNGKTAIDKFLTRFYSSCAKNTKYNFEVEVDYTPSDTCLYKQKVDSSTYEKIEPNGVINVNINDILLPFSYDLSDIYGTNTEKQASDQYEKTFAITNVPNDSYILTVTDARGNSVKKRITLEPQYISMDYSTSNLGDKYYGVESVFNLCSETELYGEINIYSIIINEKVYKIEDLVYTPFKGMYKLKCSYDNYQVWVLLTIEVTDLIDDRQGDVNFEECGCMGVGGISSISLQEDNSVRMAIWVPGTYHLNLIELCQDERTDNSTIYDIVIENGKPFEAFVNNVPLRFFATDKNHNMLTSGSPLYNGTMFPTKPIVADYKTMPLVWLKNIEHTSSYSFGYTYPMMFSKDTLSYWENYIDISYQDNSDTFDYITYLNAVTFELQSIMNMLKGAWVASDIDNYGYTMSTIGGKAPITFRLGKIEDKDINETTQRYKIRKNFTFTNYNSVKPIPFACNMVNRAYGMFTPTTSNGEDEGYYCHWATDLNGENNVEWRNDSSKTHVSPENNAFYTVGWGPNPLYSMNDDASFSQGNYMAAFSRNAGYSVNTCKILSGATYQSIPTKARVLHKQICINGAYDYLQSEWRDSNLNNYLRCQFVDKRIDYNLLVFASSNDELTITSDNNAKTGPTIIYGDIINGNTMAFHRVLKDEDGNPLPMFKDGEVYSGTSNYHLSSKQVNNKEESRAIVNQEDYLIPKYSIIYPLPQSERLSANVYGGGDFSYQYDYVYNDALEQSYLCMGNPAHTENTFYDAFVQCDTDKIDLLENADGTRRYGMRSASDKKKTTETYDLSHMGDEGNETFKIVSEAFNPTNDTYLQLARSGDNTPYLSEGYPMVRFMHLKGLPPCSNLSISLTNCDYDITPRVVKTYSAKTVQDEETNLEDLVYASEPDLSIDSTLNEGDTHTINLRIDGLYRLVDGGDLAHTRMISKKSSGDTNDNQDDNIQVGLSYSRLFDIKGELVNQEVAVKIEDDTFNNTHKQHTISILKLPFNVYKNIVTNSTNSSNDNYTIEQRLTDIKANSKKFNFYSFTEDKQGPYSIAEYVDEFFRKKVENLCNGKKSIKDIGAVFGMSNYDLCLDKKDKKVKPKNYQQFQNEVIGNHRYEINLVYKKIQFPSILAYSTVEVVTNVENSKTDKVSGTVVDLKPSYYEGCVDGFREYNNNPYRIWDFTPIYRKDESIASDPKNPIASLIQELGLTTNPAKNYYYCGPVDYRSGELLYNEQDEIQNALDNGEYYWYTNISSSDFKDDDNKLAIVAETLYVNDEKNNLGREIKVINMFDIVENINMKNAYTANCSQTSITINFDIAKMTKVYGEDWYNDPMVFMVHTSNGDNVENLWVSTDGVDGECGFYEGNLNSDFKVSGDKFFETLWNNQKSVSGTGSVSFTQNDDATKVTLKITGSKLYDNSGTAKDYANFSELTNLSRIGQDIYLWCFMGNGKTDVLKLK